MKAVLIAQWKNHPKGTVLDVSDGILSDLKNKGLVASESQPIQPPPDGPAAGARGSARPSSSSARNKMILESPEQK
jgi:hypothetical protein